MRKLVWIVLFFVCLSALPVAAQEDDRGPITWLAYSRVNPGMTEDAVAMVAQEQEMMDKLVADGTVLTWGAVTPINHSPGDTWNFAQWVTVPGWAEVDAWAGAVMGKMAAQSDEEKKAEQEQFEKVFVMGSHFDEIVRHAVVSRGSGAEPRYYYAAEFKAQPGQGDAMVEFFEDAVAPLLDPLVADGTLTSYGAYSTEIHITADWTHRFWYGLPGLGSIDKMTKAFEDAQSPSFDAWAGSVFDLSGHSDRVLMVLHYGN